MNAAREEGEDLYDGRERLGTIVRRPGGFEAYDANERFLKLFADRSSAVAALREARQWRLTRVGAAR